MRRRALLLVICILAATSGHAVAAVDPMGMIISEFREAALGISGRLQAEGGKLLFGLGAIQIAWNSIQLLLKGEFSLEAAAGVVLRPMISLAMWAGFILVAPSWIPSIIAGWQALGASVSGAAALNPGAIFMLGIDLAAGLSEALKEAVGADSWLGMVGSPYAAFQVGILEILVVITFLILAVQVALAMLKAYLWLAIAPMLMGFGGLKNTADIALNTLKSAISIGVVILTTYIVVAIGLRMEPTWRALIGTVTTETLNLSMWYVIGSGGLIALLAWQVPKIASDFINGTISGGASEMAGVALTAAAGAAVLGAGVAGAAGLARDGVQAGASNVAGLADLAGAAMGDARDHGKSGLEGVSHAFGSTLETGGGFARSALTDMAGAAKDWATAGRGDTAFGKMASAIEAGRGGSIGPGPAIPGDKDGGSASTGGPSSSGGASGGGGSPSASAMSSGSRDEAVGGDRAAPASAGGTAASSSGTSGSGTSASMAAADSRGSTGDHGVAPGTVPGAAMAAAGASTSSAGGSMAGDGFPPTFDLVKEFGSPYSPSAADTASSTVDSSAAPEAMGGDPGNATGAALSGPEAAVDAGGPSWASKMADMASQIHRSQEYLPEGGADTVGVSANLHGGQDV